MPLVFQVFSPLKARNVVFKHRFFHSELFSGAIFTNNFFLNILHKVLSLLIPFKSPLWQILFYLNIVNDQKVRCSALRSLDWKCFFSLHSPYLYRGYNISSLAINKILKKLNIDPRYCSCSRCAQCVLHKNLYQHANCFYCSQTGFS